jgi:hypothetical protein
VSTLKSVHTHWETQRFSTLTVHREVVLPAMCKQFLNRCLCVVWWSLISRKRTPLTKIIFQAHTHNNERWERSVQWCICVWDAVRNLDANKLLLCENFIGLNCKSDLECKNDQRLYILGDWNTKDCYNWFTFTQINRFVQIFIRSVTNRRDRHQIKVIGVHL